MDTPNTIAPPSDTVASPSDTVIESLTAYHKSLATSTRAALGEPDSAPFKVRDDQDTHDGDTCSRRESREWRNLSDPEAYEEWVVARREKPIDWRRYQDERLAKSVRGDGDIDKTKDETKVASGEGERRRAYWRAQDVLRGVGS